LVRIHLGLRGAADLLMLLRADIAVAMQMVCRRHSKSMRAGMGLAELGARFRLDVRGGRRRDIAGMLRARCPRDREPVVRRAYRQSDQPSVFSNAGTLAPGCFHVTSIGPPPSPACCTFAGAFMPHISRTCASASSLPCSSNVGPCSV